MQMPYWNAGQRPGPRCEQPIVRRFITIDHIGDQRPVEAWVPVPALYPAGIAVDVERAALVPDAEGAVVEHERLAHLRDYAHVVLAWEGHQGVTTRKEPGPILPGAPDRGTVVVDHCNGRREVTS